MTETLFVYGTLMPNCPNGHVLEDIVGKFIPATVERYDEFEVDTFIYVLKASDDMIDD